MKAKWILCAMLVLTTLALSGCRRRRSEGGTGEVDKIPGQEATAGKVDPAEGFDLSPGAFGGALKERDLPLAERQPEMGTFRDPETTGLLGAEGAKAGEEDLALIFRDVQFEYDRYRITPRAAEVLTPIGEYLRGHGNVSVVIEGHCDERGSSEYNLALGEKRALSVREFLSAMGVAGSRLHTVSFGEEYPLDSGHNEKAWGLNRRAHFRVRE